MLVAPQSEAKAKIKLNKNSFKEAVDSDDADPLFASVIKNAEFRQQFLATIKEIGSTNFKYETASAKLYEMKELYEPLIDEHYARYGYTSSRNWLFNTQTNRIDSFLRDRYDTFIPMLENDLNQY